MDIRQARKTLGWSRDDLATRATVDKRVLQLIELGHSHDTEAIARCEAALADALAAHPAGLGAVVPMPSTPGSASEG